MSIQNKAYLTGISALAFVLMFSAAQPCISTAENINGSGVTVYWGMPDTKALDIKNNKAIVQLLLRERKKVDLVNSTLATLDASGRIVALLRKSDTELPYPDNFINRLVVIEKRCPGDDEILRVLTPGGTASLPDGKVLHKEYSQYMDDWPQWQHGADNVAVSKDRLVGPPRHMQWLQSPPWGRMHNDLEIPAPITLVLSCNGRVFYDADEGFPNTSDLPYHFHFFARDAFNGSLLWKRTLPHWYDGEEYRRGNPPIVIQRRVVCCGDILYMTESDAAPVEKIDAASGKPLKIYSGTENAMELVADGEFLYIVCWKKLPGKKFVGYSNRMGYISKWYPADTPRDKLPRGNGVVKCYQNDVSMRLIKLNTTSGRIVWQRSDEEVNHIFPLTLAVKDGGVFFKAPEYLVRLDAGSGRTVWKSKIGIPLSDNLGIAIEDKRNWVRHLLLTRPSPWYLNIQFVGKCIPYRDIVLTTTYDRLHCVSAKDGEDLWDVPASEGFFLPADIMPIGDKVYIGSKMGDDGFTVVDLKTGKHPGNLNMSNGGMVHHRCYRRLATVTSLLTSKAGIEFYDLKNNKFSQNQWTRGSCMAGFIPANSMLYVTPHPCACFTRIKTNGMLAFSPAKKEHREGIQLKSRLEKGEAYNDALKFKHAHPSDWSEFRHDSMRSGINLAGPGPQLQQAWSVDFRTRISQVSAAGDAVYVAAADKHTLYALVRASGVIRWHYTTAGRIDTPPTVRGDYVVFGCADGWTYCLTAKTGALIWRFHASPTEKYIGVFGQLESSWPVHGAVVVQSRKNINNGQPVVYINAGRNSYLDGGIVLCGVDLKSGRLVCENQLDGTLDKDGNPVVEKQWVVKGLKNDILVADKQNLYIKDYAYKPDCQQAVSNGSPHLVATGLSLLDSYRHHRSLWVIGCDTPYFANQNFSGELLSFDSDVIYSFRAQNGARNGGTRSTSLYRIGAFKRASTPSEVSRKYFITRAKKIWSIDTDIICNAMAVSGISTNRYIFYAGAVNPRNPAGLDKVLDDADAESVLKVISDTAKGREAAEYKLPAQPVYDGMAIAGNQLFISLKNGRLVSFCGTDKR